MAASTATATTSVSALGASMANLKLDEKKQEKKTQLVDSNVKYICLQANDDARVFMLEYVLRLATCCCFFDRADMILMMSVRDMLVFFPSFST